MSVQAQAAGRRGEPAEETRPGYALRPPLPVRRQWPVHLLGSTSAGLVATGAAPIGLGGGSAAMTVAASASAGVAAGWTVLAVRRQRRAEIEEAARATLERVTGQLTYFRVRHWRGRFVGVPRRIRFRYQPAGVLNDKGKGVWPATGVAILAAALGGRYAVARHDSRRGTISLRWVPAPVERFVDAREERAGELMKQLFGQAAEVSSTITDDVLSKVVVRHDCGIKATFASWRERVGRVVSTMLEGRWRARWDLESDSVVFELRPEMPRYAERPAPVVDPAHPDFFKIPLGVDEDHNVVYWDLASSMPHFLVSGKTGKGKACSIRTEIATPSGWSILGDLVVGDRVFDDQGRPVMVTGVFDQPSGRDCFEVRFSDGATLVADAEHLWWTEDRASRTRRWFRRQPHARRPLLPPEVVGDLRVRAAAAAEGDTITVPEAAALFGLPATSHWLYEVAETVGSSAQRTRVVDNPYREQVVVQTQQVTLFEGAGAAVQLQAAADRGRLGQRAGQVDEVALPTAVSLRELHELTGVSIATLRNLLHKSGVHSRVERRCVQLHVPAKTVRRTFGTVAAYPTRDFLLALAARGEDLRSDQRAANPTGGQVRTTREIRETLRTATGHLNHSIPTTAALHLPEAALPIAPYTLGCWLGDGDSWAPVITSADPEVIEHIEADGFQVRQHHLAADASKACRQYYILGFRRQLKALGLLKTDRKEPSKKRIPAPYLRASIEQRRALLAGLMDTDGTVSPQGTSQFTTTLVGLADDVEELIASLGYRVSRLHGTAKLDGRVTGPKWTLAFTTADPVFRLSRKAKAQAERTARHNPDRTRQRYITAVRPVPEVPMRCITVDSPSHLFLAGRAMIPTHNTTVLRGVVMELAARQLKVWLIDPKRVELIALRDWANVQLVATVIEQQVATVLQAWKLMEERYAAIEAGASEEDFEMLVIVLDEFAEFSRRVAQWWARIKRQGMPAVCPVFEAFDSLVRLGRTARIRIAIGIQRPDARFFGESAEARDNFDSRLSLGRLSPDGSRMMWGSMVGTSLPGVNGRAIACTSEDEAAEIQTYWIPDPRRLKVDSDPGDRAALERMRPATATHGPLQIVIPEPALDDKKRPLVWEAINDAVLEPAGPERDVDLDLHEPTGRDGLDTEEAPDGRATNDQPGGRPATPPDTGAAPSGGARVRPSKTPAPSRRASPYRGAAAGRSGTVVPFRPREPAQPADDYGPVDEVPAADVADGDLILVDDRWVVVEAAEPDLLTSGAVALAWRSVDDGDDDGTETVSGDHTLPRRSPLDD